MLTVLLLLSLFLTFLDGNNPLISALFSLSEHLRTGTIINFVTEREASRRQERSFSPNSETGEYRRFSGNNRKFTWEKG